ncbi:MAG: DUF59 domain-containing protein [Gammaproteobacteria bacterium]|nr:DUF59 domain-containing protein [Gammaproteobacteria bacterium]
MTKNITEQMVYGALRSVLDPELQRSVVELGFIREIDISNDYVHLDIQLTTPHCPRAEEIVETIRQAVLGIRGVREVEVERVCQKDVL